MENILSRPRQYTQISPNKKGTSLYVIDPLYKGTTLHQSGPFVVGVIGLKEPHEGDGIVGRTLGTAARQVMPGRTATEALSAGKVRGHRPPGLRHPRISGHEDEHLSGTGPPAQGDSEGIRLIMLG